MSNEEKIRQRKEKSSSPLRKTNYKIGFFADSKNIDLPSLKAVLHTFFPYHLICGNNKIEKIVKQIAADYVCTITEIDGECVEELFYEMTENEAETLFVVWDGESEDGRHFLKLAHKEKLNTYIHYER
jgi:hypothetical protein